MRLGVERLRGGGGLEVEARAVHEVGGLLGGVGQRAQVCILQRELGLEHRESIEGVCQRGGEALGEFAEFAAVEPRMQRCELLAAGGAVGVRHGGARLDVVVLRTSKGGVDGGVRKILRLRAEQGAQPIGALVGGKGAQLCKFDVQRTRLADHGGAEIGVSISGNGFAIGDQRLGGVGVDRTRGHQSLGHAQVELRARNRDQRRDDQAIFTRMVGEGELRAQEIAGGCVVATLGGVLQEKRHRARGRAHLAEMGQKQVESLRAVECARVGHRAGASEFGAERTHRGQPLVGARGANAGEEVLLDITSAVVAVELGGAGGAKFSEAVVLLGSVRSCLRGGARENGER